VSDSELVAEKTEQATTVLEELDVDCWLTFCRETAAIPDPSLPLVLGFDVVWPTAVVVAPSGYSAVVLGRHDAPNAREFGVHEVYPYDESIEDSLLEVLDRVDPAEIAVNYSEDDVVADGLTHGLYRRLTDLLAGTDYEGRLESAEEVVARVRGQKSTTELERIQRAVATTEGLLESLPGAYWPEWTERDVQEHLHGRMDERGLEPSWSRPYCPSVHAGGDAEVGHTTPGNRTVPDRELLHVDFGVKVEGYAADVQRLYVRGETIPPDLSAAFEDVRAAVEAGVAALEPGAVGHRVDAVAREEITGRGHDEYPHALGHQVGRQAHDGATLLGPRWDRYGGAVEREVHAGEVYTVELGVETDYGYVGQEEMVVVREGGAEYLTDPQREIWSLDG